MLGGLLGFGAVLRNSPAYFGLDRRWEQLGARQQRAAPHLLRSSSMCVCGLSDTDYVVRKQVNQATKLKAKAGRLQESAAELLKKAKTEKETAASLKAT